MPLIPNVKNIFSEFLRNSLSVAKQDRPQLKRPSKILVIRQHNQFGDMLASVSLFRAIKETYPGSELMLIASPENYFAVEKNPFIDSLFVFVKSKLINPFYFARLKSVLNRKYDLAIVPATVAISSTSCILCGFSDAKYKIGPGSLEGKENSTAYVFHHRVDLNWKKYPDAHVSDFILDIVRPLGITTRNFSTAVPFESADMEYAEKFIGSIKSGGEIIVGFHVGAGKPQNRWPLNNFVELIKKLQADKNIKIFFTGSSADKQELDYMKKYFPDAGFFINKKIAQLAALISLARLFITNDTGVMHVAGATKTAQISLFGPTNPFNWAPIGINKYFLRRSDLIADISVKEVYDLACYIIENRKVI